MNNTDVHFRVYEEEKATIRERAADHGLSISEYLRRLVVAEEREALMSRITPLKNVRTISKL